MYILAKFVAASFSKVTPFASCPYNKKALSGDMTQCRDGMPSFGRRAQARGGKVKTLCETFQSSGMLWQD
jgi:hypothetical protein